MSIGFEGKAFLILADEDFVIYQYGCRNLNAVGSRSEMTCDGTIMLAKSAFVPPEIHVKTVKSPSGRKRIIEKRIPRDIPVYDLLCSGQIVIENCSACWMKDPLTGLDKIAIHLIFKLIAAYQTTGQIPESAFYSV